MIGLGREKGCDRVWRDAKPRLCEIQQAACRNRNMGIWQNPAPGTTYQTKIFLKDILNSLL